MNKQSRHFFYYQKQLLPTHLTLSLRITIKVPGDIREKGSKGNGSLIDKCLNCEEGPLLGTSHTFSWA